MTTDLEIVRKCAERMGIAVKEWNEHAFAGAGLYMHCRDSQRRKYDPLNCDADNAALDDVILKRGSYEMMEDQFTFYDETGTHDDFTYEADMTLAENRRRARCLCVAGLKG